MRQQLAMLLIGSTFNRINVADIKGLIVVVPPRTEQDAIVEHLDSALVDTVRAQSAASDEIPLLRELRTRLTADVVTGKLDVREAAARLPADAPEPEALDESEMMGDIEGTAADDAASVAEEAQA